MPIRIRDRSSTEPIPRLRSGTQLAPRLAAAAPSFRETLTAVQSGMLRQDLDHLFEELEEQGRALVEQPTPEALERYKKQVRDFIAYVVKHALKLRSSFTARQLHQIVERVDEELLALADAVLSQERPVLEIAAQVDRINGILLDLKA